MSEPHQKTPPRINLQEMRERVKNAQPIDVDPSGAIQEITDRIARGEEVVADQQGRLYNPSDPEIANTPLPNKTVVKPQRWF